MALRFGVTTELETQGTHTGDDRAHITDDDTLAEPSWTSARPG
ncbi:hypothetical protein NKH77_51285 [Streptomyces sp. M19]